MKIDLRQCVSLRCNSCQIGYWCPIRSFVIRRLFECEQTFRRRKETEKVDNFIGFFHFYFSIPTSSIPAGSLFNTIFLFIFYFTNKFLKSTEFVAEEKCIDCDEIRKFVVHFWVDFGGAKWFNFGIKRQLSMANLGPLLDEHHAAIENDHLNVQAD